MCIDRTCCEFHHRSSIQTLKKNATRSVRNGVLVLNYGSAAMPKMVKLLRKKEFYQCVRWSKRLRDGGGCDSENQSTTKEKEVMVKKEKTSRTRVLVVVGLVVFHIAMFAGILSNFLEDDRGEFSVMEKWRDESPKISMREWIDDGVRFSEICHNNLKGELVGCGVDKNGDHWEGVFVDWYRYKKYKPEKEERYGILKSVKQYEDGKPDGVWQVFYAFGIISSEIEYADGERVGWRYFNPAGELVKSGTVKESR